MKPVDRETQVSVHTDEVDTPLLRVLLVEDNPADAHLISSQLADLAMTSLAALGFDLQWVDSLSAALDCLAAGDIDLVLLDLKLPDSRGLDTFTQVQAQASSVPIVVLSGTADEDLAVRSVREGAQDYLVKGQVDGSLLVRAMLYAVERKRAEEELRRRNEELLALNVIAPVLNSTLELEEVLGLILQQLRQVIPYDSASIQQLRGTQLEVTACQGTADPDKVVGLTFPLDPELPNYRVIRSRKPVAFENIARDHAYFRDEAEKYGCGPVRSWLGIPLIVKERVIGMIALGRATTCPFTTREFELATAFANHAANAIENAHLYQQLQRQMEELTNTQAQLIQSAKLAAVGELAAGVAHELNNPLTIILGFAELLMEEFEREDRQRKDLEMITGEAHRARAIIRNLLDFARQSESQWQTAGLNEVLDQTLGLIRKQLADGRVVVEETYDPDVPPLRVNVGQVKQVFLNLINNAVQAMPQGGRLVLRTALEGDEVVVTISDNGTGIPKELRSRIFEPFFTTKASGTGLGLSVSQGIVREHGGRIVVESELGQGSTFTVRLPIRTRAVDSKAYPPAGFVVESS